MPAERTLATPDVASRRVVVVAASFLAFVAVAGGVMVLVYRAQVLERPQPPRLAFPAPGLQVAPRADLDALRERDTARLAGIGWVDRDAGLVRVPIADAMARVVGRGAAGFDPIEGPAVTPSPARAAADTSAGSRP